MRCEFALGRARISRSVAMRELNRDQGEENRAGTAGGKAEMSRSRRGLAARLMIVAMIRRPLLGERGSAHAFSCKLEAFNRAYGYVVLSLAGRGRVEGASFIVYDTQSWQNEEHRDDRQARLVRSCSSDDAEIFDISQARGRCKIRPSR
jgi:hypothetical protein